MDKFLILKFENAGFFNDQSKTKDRFIENGVSSPRINYKHFVEPITIHQVSNVLHVLMGERPVPSFRKTIFKRVDGIFNLAGNGYLKINTIKDIKNVVVKKYSGGFNVLNDDKPEYPNETITVRKSAYNSFSKIEIINWFKVRQLLENDLFFDFMALLNLLFGEDVYENYTSSQAMIVLREKFIDMEKYNTQNTNEFKSKVNMSLLNSCIENDDLRTFINEKFNGKTRQYSKTVMIKYILDFDQTSINSNERTLSTIPHGIDKITRLSGEIIIPLNEEYYNKLRNGSGFATILDGGAIWIDKILDEVTESDISGFTKISDISTETVNNK